MSVSPTEIINMKVNEYRCEYDCKCEYEQEFRLIDIDKFRDLSL